MRSVDHLQLVTQSSHAWVLVTPRQLHWGYLSEILPCHSGGQVLLSHSRLLSSLSLIRPQTVWCLSVLVNHYLWFTISRFVLQNDLQLGTEDNNLQFPHVLTDRAKRNCARCIGYALRFQCPSCFSLESHHPDTFILLIHFINCRIAFD